MTDVLMIGAQTSKTVIDAETVLAAVNNQQLGDFICIPSHDIGFSIGSLSDTARLEEHFRKNLGQEDAITVAAALKSMEQESE